MRSRGNVYKKTADGSSQASPPSINVLHPAVALSKFLPTTSNEATMSPRARARASDWMHTTSDDEDAVAGHGYSSDEDQRTQISRPAKRRRLSHSPSESEDEDDENLSDDEEVQRPVNGRRKRPAADDDDDEDEELEDDEDEELDEDDEDEAERFLPAVATIPLKKTKPNPSTTSLDITDSSQLTRQTGTQALGESLSKTGLIYLSRIPPYMTPPQIRQLLTPFGTISRIFLSPELPSAYQARIKTGGNKKRQFVEGWIEFQRKKDAKRCAESLNAQQVGGRKRGWWYDDLWNMKYLPGFKWNHLTAQIANENATRQARSRAEIGQTTKKSKIYLQNFKRGKMVNNMQAAAKEKKRKLEGSNDNEASLAADTLDEGNDLRRTFGQLASSTKAVNRTTVKSTASGQKSEAMKKLLKPSLMNRNYEEKAAARNRLQLLIVYRHILHVLQQIIRVDLRYAVIFVPFPVRARIHLHRAAVRCLHALHLAGTPRFVRLVQRQRLPQLLVLLDVTHEHLELALHPLLIRLLGQQLAFILGHAAQLPVSVLVLLAPRVVLLDEHDFRYPAGVLASLNTVPERKYPIAESPGWRTAPRWVRIRYVVSETPMSLAFATVASARTWRPFVGPSGSMSRTMNSVRTEASAMLPNGARQYTGVAISQRVRVDVVGCVSDLVADEDGADVAEALRELEREDDEVVFTDRDQLDRVGEFEAFRRRVDVVGNQLFGLLGLDGCDGAEEVEQLLRMRPLEEEEVEAVLDFLDVDAVADFAQSGHCWYATTYSTSNDCWSIVFSNACV
ncbi:LOW QUALITY PROTEIN: hypothetical protein Dda_2810 [Drechslerella dactyloides]|uniref:18S rRNA factor 2 n=1 Tax=Drechslerella dactyloides TaxID=74499 RepID=A0AAD6J1Q9_DREDA|nr:LOW QUALITY PROTEIN: hypothetical protein Dda_2810 [Drechslerella dactyloides]